MSLHGRRAARSRRYARRAQDFEAGGLYGLEKLWAFHHYMGLPKHAGLDIEPQVPTPAGSPRPPPGPPRPPGAAARAPRRRRRRREGAALAMPPQGRRMLQSELGVVCAVTW